MGLREVLAGASLALMGPLTHATVIYSLEDEGIYGTRMAGAHTVDFNDGSCGRYGACAPSAALVAGSAMGQHASPFGLADRYMAIKSSSMSLALDATYDYFGLYWGSVDAYNWISFHLGDTLVRRFGGDDLSGLVANGDQTSWLSNRYVNFLFEDGARFDRVTLGSTGNSFESDNHAYGLRPPRNTETVSVPEPGTLALFAVGLLGLAARRRATAR